MRSRIAKFLKNVSILKNKISEKVNETPEILYKKKVVSDWVENKGDKTLRLNYELDENSVVFDIGGYEGQWTSDIFSKYCCKVLVFEPVTKYANDISKRFEKNNKISVYNFGLSDRNEHTKMSVLGDGSSIYQKGDNQIEIKLIRFTDFLKENKIESIDLMKINIEGGEYSLLEHLIDEGVVRIIKNVQVQFHDFIPNAEQRMRSIQEKLKSTHELTYKYPFVWENWKIKK